MPLVQETRIRYKTGHKLEETLQLAPRHSAKYVFDLFIDSDRLLVDRGNEICSFVSLLTRILTSLGVRRVGMYAEQ